MHFTSLLPLPRCRFIPSRLPEFPLWSQKANGASSQDVGRKMEAVSGERTALCLGITGQNLLAAAMATAALCHIGQNPGLSWVWPLLEFPGPLSKGAHPGVPLLWACSLSCDGAHCRTRGYLPTGHIFLGLTLLGPMPFLLAISKSPWEKAWSGSGVRMVHGPC